MTTPLLTPPSTPASGPRRAARRDDTPEPATELPAHPDGGTAAPRARRRRTPARLRRQSFGTVRQLSSGRWQARLTDADGTRRPAPRTFATEREAEDWITTHRADSLRGQWRSPEVGAVPLAEYVADYLAGRVDLAPRTLDGYQRALRLWLDVELIHPTSRRVHLGGTQLRDLSPALVRDWYAAALAEARRRSAARLEASDRHRRSRALHSARVWARENGYPVKPTGRLSPVLVERWKASGAPGAATLDLPASEPGRDAGKVQVARAYQLLRSVLATAHREGLILANPCTIRGAGGVKGGERPHATPEEVARLALRMPERYAAAVHVAAWSGLRAGELFALTRAHVDLTRGTVRVERALVELPNQPVRFGPPKTAASMRTVHLPRPVVDLLAAHMARYTRPGPDALVFARADGRPLRGAVRTKHFRRACAAEGLHRLHWHDLRHTGATIAAQNGASLRELQARLGHSTVAAAMTYQHATAERDRELAERMAASMGAPPPAPPGGTARQPESPAAERVALRVVGA